MLGQSVPGLDLVIALGAAVEDVQVALAVPHGGQLIAGHLAALEAPGEKPFKGKICCRNSI